MSTSQTGISFPFRLGVKGGVMTSSTNVNKPTHIEEGITQLLLTNKFERTMETHMYSDVRYFNFKTINESLKSLLKYYIVETLKLEPRISVDLEDINIEEIKESDGNKVIAHIKYRILAYNEDEYTLSLEI